MESKVEQRLYLMRNRNGLFKVGISNNPERRRRQIELSSGVTTDIIRCWATLDADARTVEQAIHAMYARRRKHGEWFRIMTIQDVMLAGYELTQCKNDGTMIAHHREEN